MSPENANDCKWMNSFVKSAYSFIKEYNVKSLFCDMKERFMPKLFYMLVVDALKAFKNVWCPRLFHRIWIVVVIMKYQVTRKIILRIPGKFLFFCLVDFFPSVSLDKA